MGMTIEFKPCPFCGHTDIGVKDSIVDIRMTMRDLMI